MLSHAGSVIKGFDDLMREITLAKGMEIGRLAVSAGPYPSDVSGQRAMGILSARHPTLIVGLMVSNWTDTVDHVLNERVDLGLAEIYEAAKNPDLQTESLRNSTLHFFCSASHPLAGRQAVTLADLLDYPWVGPSAPGRMRQFIPEDDKPFGVFDGATDRFLPRILVETFSATKQIVLAGQGLGVALPFQLRREIDDGDCVLLSVDLPWMRLNYGFISRRGRMHSPAAKAYMDIVKELERKFPS